VLKVYPEFCRYGVLKLSARDLSIAEHVESKIAAYDERSPQQLLKAYRGINRVPFPGYLQKRSSSTVRIRCGWMDVVERTDPRKVLDPEGTAGLNAAMEGLWRKIPEILGDRAFVPSHVADIFCSERIYLPSQEGLNAVIEPLYIDGYSADFEAAVIADLPSLTSPFEAGLLGRGKISFVTTAERLESLGLLDLIETIDSRTMFRLRCSAEWDAVAAAILNGATASKEIREQAEALRRRLAEETQRPAKAKTTEPLQIMLPFSDPSQVTVGIVTALAVEFVAMEAVLNGAHPFAAKGDPNRYVVGSVPASSSVHNVALMQLARMRNDSAASGATNILRTFPNIDLLIMTGIALALPNPARPDKHVRLGDIIVSDRKGIIQIDHLAIDPSGTENRSNLPPPSASATHALNTLDQLAEKGERPWLAHLDSIIQRLPRYARPIDDLDVLLDDSGAIIAHPVDEEREPEVPRVFKGAIGSANALVRDPRFRDKVRDQYGLYAVEMEGAGVAESAWQFDRYYLVVRSACDYGFPKGDTWHRYAAAAAAAYTRALLEQLAV
jgi:nucleoside phosphorylase